MDIQTEQLLGTIEVLLEERLICRLPCNETSEWKPFVWDSDEKGELNTISLLKIEGWIKPTDIEIAIQNWQDIEQSGVPTPYDDYAEDRFDDDDYQDRAAPEFVNRKVIYQQLADYITANLKNLQVYQLSSDSVYSCFAIVGEIEEDNWICITSTVPQETPNFEDILVVEDKDESVFGILHNESKSTIVSQIKKILSSLTPVKIYGFYDGAYEHTYQHQILYQVASTEEQVFEKALTLSKFLDINKFKTFYPDPEEYIFTDYAGREEGAEWYSQYQRLNEFLKNNFTQLMVYKFNFWKYTHVFVIGQSSGNDWVGLRLKSEFDYNP
ncbi:hypothetical protein NIES4071_37540 [Calothrix sp. NIES-4071]|nr:hypothetical protein NIES4071_37540 [Calothrix sp. NIES-4071]BAZ58071.1 hypothetical protein NIES4105_37470 [Calothrix sp. NIES-4105]